MLACVLLFKKTRPGSWHTEKFSTVASEEIRTHGTHYGNVLSMSGLWRGLRGEVNPVDDQ